VLGDSGEGEGLMIAGKELVITGDGLVIAGEELVV
jgi:hypothetical protein